MPFQPLILRKRLIGAEDIAAARPAERKLHDHDRKTERDQEKQIDQHEDRAAVLAADERETPDVAETDRTARRKQNETEPGTEILPG